MKNLILRMAVGRIYVYIMTGLVNLDVNTELIYWLVRKSSRRLREGRGSLLENMKMWC